MKNTFEELFVSDKDTTELPIGTNSKGDDVFIIVAEAGNEKHKKLQRKYTKALENSRYNEKKRNIIFAQICAGSLLVDWKGFIDDKGKEIKASYENKLDYLVKYEKLVTAVLEAATDPVNFQDDFDPGAEEETEKN